MSLCWVRGTIPLGKLSNTNLKPGSAILEWINSGGSEIIQVYTYTKLCVDQTAHAFANNFEICYFYKRNLTLRLVKCESWALNIWKNFTGSRKYYTSDGLEEALLKQFDRQKYGVATAAHNHQRELLSNSQLGPEYWVPYDVNDQSGALLIWTIPEPPTLEELLPLKDTESGSRLVNYDLPYVLISLVLLCSSWTQIIYSISKAHSPSSRRLSNSRRWGVSDYQS